MEKQTRGPWDIIHSPDKNSYCIFANAMQHSSSNATATGTQIWPYHKKVKGHPSLIILTNGKPRVPNAVYQDSASKLSWFWRRRFLSVFIIYGHGGHLVHGMEPFEQIGNTHSTEGPMCNLMKIAQAVPEKKTFKYYTILYINIAQGQEQITTRGQNFDYN